MSTCKPFLHESPGIHKSSHRGQRGSSSGEDVGASTQQDQLQHHCQHQQRPTSLHYLLCIAVTIEAPPPTNYFTKRLLRYVDRAGAHLSNSWCERHPLSMNAPPIAGAQRRASAASSAAVRHRSVGTAAPGSSARARVRRVASGTQQRPRGAGLLASACGDPGYDVSTRSGCRPLAPPATGHVLPAPAVASSPRFKLRTPAVRSITIGKGQPKAA